MIPDAATTPCPDAGKGLEVQVHRVAGEITAVGRGNLIDDRVRGPPATLRYQPLKPGEATVLRSFFGHSVLNRIGNGDWEAPVLYACEADRCRAAFRYGATLVTLVWSPTAVRVPPHQVVDQAASHLQEWSQYEPRPPSISKTARSRAQSDARAAVRRKDFRPIAFRGFTPDAEPIWSVHGFGCSTDDQNFRQMDERTQDSLEADLGGYVLEYNRIMTRRLGCRAPKAGAAGTAFASPPGG